jgi:hypothetical protein
MFGTEPTPFDVRLQAFRIPIRVHPSFWIAGAALSWNPDHLDFVFLWVMCLFVSILVHEMGHALMAEAFCWESEIVLYWGGGLAMSQRYHNRTPWREIAVSLAGPFAGFGLFALTLLVEPLLQNQMHDRRDLHQSLLGSGQPVAGTPFGWGTSVPIIFDVVPTSRSQPRRGDNRSGRRGTGCGIFLDAIAKQFCRNHVRDVLHAKHRLPSIRAPLRQLIYLAKQVSHQ